MIWLGGEKQSQNYVSLTQNPLQLSLHHIASYMVLGLGNVQCTKVVAKVRGAKCSSSTGPSSWINPKLLTVILW